MKKISLRSASNRQHGCKRQTFRSRFIEQLEGRRVMAVDWRNPVDSLDVSQDQLVTPIDALLVINEINLGGSRRLADARQGTAPYLDASGDQFLSPIDALLVINHLNSTGSGARTLSENGRLASESAVTTTLGQSGGTRKLRYQIDASFDTRDQASLLKDQLAVYLVDPANTSRTLLDRGVAGTSLFTWNEVAYRVCSGHRGLGWIDPRDRYDQSCQY